MMSELCARYGVSRWVGYKWMARCEEEGRPPAALVRRNCRTTRPRTRPAPAPAQATPGAPAVWHAGGRSASARVFRETAVEPTRRTEQQRLEDLGATFGPEQSTERGSTPGASLGAGPLYTHCALKYTPC